MGRPTIEERVLCVLASILKRDLASDTDATRENTEGWDSLKHVELIFAIEDEFAMEFSEEELGGLDSVSRISSLIRAKNAT